MGDGSTGAITFEYTLRCDAEHAFSTYAERIGEWWDPRFSADAETLETVTIEPRVGGRVFASHGNDGIYDWGVVTVWEPGSRLVHTFTLAQDAAHASEVAVEFLDGEGGGATMRFAHGGWNEANAETRKKFGDWPVMLDRFAALADSGG
jgi:Activator of Hsp90 ATPase homolog 1-like protein